MKISESIHLTNALLPNGQRTNIYIADGQIAGSSTDQPPQGSKTYDCNGYLVLPGLIDPHVHFRTPGGEHKETWETGCQAAILGGVTTVVDMPNTNPSTSTHEALEKKILQIGERPINWRLNFGATPTNYREIYSVAKDPRVQFVKMYMGSSTGDLLVENVADQRRVMEITADVGLRVAVHAEDEELMRRNSHRIKPTKPSDHCLVRDAEVEISSVKSAIKSGLETGAKLYFCHLSHPDSLHLVRDAKDRGLDAVAEVCPHHLSLNSCRLEGDEAAFFVMNPPLRSPIEVQRLQSLVCRDGFVDVIGSDHAPHTFKEKAKPYPQTPSGVPGVQTILSVLLQLVPGRMSLERFVALTSGNFGQLLGGKKGSLAIGAEADLIVLDPNHQWTITNEWMASKMPWTPFHGLSVWGQLKAVMVGGQFVHQV